MEAGLEALVRKITNLGLEVAANKTEAAWFHGLPQNRRPPKSWIAVRGDRIRVGTSIKYLGLVLDGRLNFEAHFVQLAPRVEKVALSLGRILPNIGSKRERETPLHIGNATHDALRGTDMGRKESYNATEHQSAKERPEADGS